MTNLNNIDPIDESLRLIYLDQLKKMTTDQTQLELSRVLTSGLKDMPGIKKDLMLSRLAAVMQRVTFGNLLEQTMKEKAINEKALAEKTGLTLGVINELRTDKVYPNNIPIRLLKELIHTLQFSFDSAKSAMLNTFEQLKNQAMLDKSSIGGFTPAFRKGYEINSNNSGKQISGADGKELFENEVALNKYLNRLEELMNE